MKEAAKFTRESPANKVHINNAFWRDGDYAAVPLVDAKRVFGDNVPKFLLKKGYMRHFLQAGVDMYQLTADGRTWLRDGLARHLELHPEDRANVRVGTEAARPVLRRRTR